MAWTAYTTPSSRSVGNLFTQPMVALSMNLMNKKGEVLDEEATVWRVSGAGFYYPEDSVDIAAFIPEEEEVEP